MYYAKRQEYIARATPPWADLKAIEKVYERCAAMTIHTGIEHQVDHIVPLQHPLVCGLHIAENLQILPARENLKKRNKYFLKDV